MSEKILVTGGLSGIGGAITRKLIETGHFVVFTHRKNCDSIEDILSAYGTDCCLPVYCDIQDGRIDDKARQIIAEQEGLSALVNNIGVSSEAIVYQTEPDAFWRTVTTNIGAAYEFSRLVWPLFLKRRGGKIINISSAAVENVRIGNGIYAASKAFVDRMADSMALEGARFGICVNTIAPGFTLTPMLNAAFEDADKRRAVQSQIPTRKFQTPDDIAATVLWLIQFDVFLTGARLPVAGGGHL